MSFYVSDQLQYTPGEAFEQCAQGAVILDIRPELLCIYKGFDVPEILFCPWQEIDRYLDQLPADREIIVADTCGIQAREVIKTLIGAGFARVAGLAGGMVEWEADGLPVVLDNKARLSGSCMCQLKFRDIRSKRSIT